MLSSLLGKSYKNSVAERCAKDDATKQRLKYEPYYHHFERQEGAHVWLDGRELVLLSSNDYLGLNHHPKVQEAGQKALKKWGSSSTGSRIANGSRSYHRQLEEKIADFLGKEDCQVHAAGYLSCMSAIQPFVQRGDLVLADKNIHSALWTGIKTTMCKLEKFSHNDPEDLGKSSHLRRKRCQNSSFLKESTRWKVTSRKLRNFWRSPLRTIVSPSWTMPTASEF